MAIEGPLRELGIHDVFQLLDLSRKTGVLRVSSDVRDDEGLVYFDSGRVVQATIRSKAMPIELALLQAGRITESDLQRARARQAQASANDGAPSRDVVDKLIELGAITHKELDRTLRLQIESVVFELMSWREGFFSFEERSKDELPHDTRMTVSTESLLMEGARRIDEWSRIAETVPSIDVVPELAPVEDDRGGAMLDLLPHEWQVLTMIDGSRDLRGIAAALARDEFEIAKIAYGLATTGVIVVRRAEAEEGGAPSGTRNATDVSGRADGRLAPRRTTPEARLATSDESPEAVPARSLADQIAASRTAVEQFLHGSPSGPAAPEARDALEALTRLQHVLQTQMETEVEVSHG